jgi:hypothetical protein
VLVTAVVGLVVGLLLGPAAGPASADGWRNGAARQGGVLVTTAAAQNTGVGTARTDLAFVVRRAGLGVVRARNRAWAYAHCRNCRTVAVSFQVVLAGGSGVRVRVDNDAVAVNDRCRRCRTSALAYQFVVKTRGTPWLTRRGSAELARAEAELAGLLAVARRNPQGGNAGLEAAVTDVARQVSGVLSREVREGAGPARYHAVSTRRDG